MKRLTVLSVALGMTLLVPAAAQGDRKPYQALQRAGEMISKGKYRDAELLMMELRHEIPKSFSLWFQLALARQMQSRLKSATKAIEQAIELEPKNTAGLLLGAELTLRIARKKSLAWTLRAGVAGRKDDKVLRKVVELLVKLGDHQSALPILEKILKKSPNDIKLLELQAKIALASRQLKQAAAAYRRIVKLRPRDPIAVESLGNVLFLLDEHAEAIKVLELSLKIRPSNLDTRAKLINLLVKTQADEKRIELHKKYLDYYRWVHEKHRQRGARPPKNGR